MSAMLMTGVPLASLKGKQDKGEIKPLQVTAPPPPRMKPHDANVVLQLLEEIHQLVSPGKVLATESPRLSAAAKLYLDTRDTFEVIEQKVEEHLPERPKILRKLSKRTSINKEIVKANLRDASASSSPMVSPEPTPRALSVTSVVAVAEELSEGVIDRIQEMFRYLGEQLGPAILKELKHRKLTVQSILYYVRFLPADCQWTAYKDARKEQVALAYQAPSSSQQQAAPETHMLKQHAEFIKEHIRKDVDTVCLFSADGTLSTIFGDDIKADKELVAEKFESLVTDVYSSYLRSIIDAEMDHLIQLSDHWQQQMAASRTIEPPFAQHFSRIRKFRTKINIFPNTMFTLEDRLAGLPQPATGQTLKVFVADLRDLGIWWQKSVLSMTERDVSTTHTDESRGISGRVESLDGHIYLPILTDNNSNNDAPRRFWKSGVLAKWIGQSLLVNNGKDSIWVEVVVKDVDDKKCKLELKKSLEGCVEVWSWKQLLASNEWLTIRDFKFMAVPLNPNFRFHMGQKLRDVLDIIQSVVVEISSIFPNDELNRKVGNALWRSVEASVSKGEHIYARYLRSTLNQEVLPRRGLLSRATRERSSSVTVSSVRNLVAAFENTALGTGSDSISMPTPGSPPNSAPGESRNNSIADKLAPGHFDDQGRYHYQPVSRITTNTAARGAAMSPFEKLSHHLLEETEIVGICIQSNNVAFGRAFVQVLHEKITKVLRNLQSKFENEQTSTVEVVLAEYANTCRFQYVWRICRHELDTMPRQSRGRRDANNMHTEWVDRTFESMDKLIIEMIHQQLHFAHRVFFHECSSYFLPGIYEQAWHAGKPWFSNSRCTYSVQFFIMRLHDLLEHMFNKLLPQYERTLAVHEKLHNLAVWMLLDILPCLATSYETLVVSRARTMQWKIDVLYIVYGVHKLLRLLDRMLIPRITMPDDKAKHKRKSAFVCLYWEIGCQTWLCSHFCVFMTHTATCEVRAICLRLLACAAIRSGPADIVLDAVAKKIEADNFYQQVDATAELEFHVNSIVTSLGSSSGPPIPERDEVSKTYAKLLGVFPVSTNIAISLSMRFRTVMKLQDGVCTRCSAPWNCESLATSP